MLNKPLREVMNVALDTMSMQGPIKIRDVAERTLSQAPSEYWSLDVDRAARIDYLCRHVKHDMAEKLSMDYVEKYLPRIPEEYHAMFKGFPKYICINPRGGRDSEHVLTILASPEQWAANIHLKDRVLDATQSSRNKSRDFLDLLKDGGAESLYDLFGE